MNKNDLTMYKNRCVLDRKAFTLIELLAVIVILAIIALISTPIIIGVIEKARKGSFENTAYGVYDAATLYFTDKLADTNKFSGKIFNFNENTDDLKISGEKPKEGYVSIDQNGVVSLAISNDNWCTKIDAGNKKAYTVDGKCAERSLKEVIEEDTTHIVRNTKINGEVVNKIKGTKEERLTMKNYVWYSGQLWQALETNNSKGTIKLISSQSLTSIAFGETNDWNSSWVRKWLNDDKFYPALENKDYIVEADFCIEDPAPQFSLSDVVSGPNSYGIAVVQSHTPIQTCTKSVKTKVGLMTFEDYAYAENGNEPSYLGTSFLSDDDFVWTMTPFTQNSTSNRMWIQWFSNGYLSTGINTAWSRVNSNGIGVRPVINVKDTVMVESGTGTAKDPYILFGEKRVGKDGFLSSTKVGDYVYLEETNNPYALTSEAVISGLYFPASKDKVRYRVVAKDGEFIKVQRSDILSNITDPSIATLYNRAIPFYYSSTCYLDENGNKMDTGCVNHNFYSVEGSGVYTNKNELPIGYFLNNAPNSFYNWYSENTKKMIDKVPFDLPVYNAYGDYQFPLTGETNYPVRTSDGKVEAYVGLPNLGEMYTGNDINKGYWYINRAKDNSTQTMTIDGSGGAYPAVPGKIDAGVRPVLRLKRDVKIKAGKGTMKEPYTLT